MSETGENNVRTGYKVVGDYGSGLVSAIVVLGEVTYIPNEWVTPLEGYGPLVLFTDQNDAEEYMFPCTRLFRCEYIPSDYAVVWKKGSPMVNISDWPKSAALADSIKLLDEIIPTRIGDMT